MVTAADLIRRGTELLTSVSDTPRLDAEVILCNLLGIDRIQLHIYPEREISREMCRIFWENAEKRRLYMPIQYITKQQEFMGLDFFVDKGVLIPRGDTEILVEEALSIYERELSCESIAVLDIGTGSGAIAVSLAKMTGASLVYAVDISSAALEIAAQNAVRNGVADKIIFRLGDIYEGLREDRLGKIFDLIVSNPPYIPDGEVECLSPQVKDFEPRLALAGGADGLDFYKRIISGAKQFLKPGGWLLFEIGCEQGEAVSRLMLEGGFTNVKVLQDLAGLDRVVSGKNK